MSTTPDFAPAPSAPAGWYPDPEGSGRKRFWDGGRWTDALVDVIPPPPSPAPAPGLGNPEPVGAKQEPGPEPNYVPRMAFCYSPKCINRHRPQSLLCEEHANEDEQFKLLMNQDERLIASLIKDKSKLARKQGRTVPLDPERLPVVTRLEPVSDIQSPYCYRMLCCRGRLNDSFFCAEHQDEDWFVARRMNYVDISSMIKSKRDMARSKGYDDLGLDPATRIQCPHCQVAGRVSTKRVNQKRGVSGGKATGAILTGGVSLLATGLSRKEMLTEAHCANCNSTWTF